MLIRRANQTSCNARALPQPGYSLEICQGCVDLQCSRQGGHSLVSDGILLQAKTQKSCICPQPEYPGAGRRAAKGTEHRARCAEVPWGSLPRGAQDLPTCIPTYSRLARLLLDLSACASAVAAFA